jgi:hypothetical protein
MLFGLDELGKSTNARRIIISVIVLRMMKEKMARPERNWRFRRIHLTIDWRLDEINDEETSVFCRNREALLGISMWRYRATRSCTVIAE